MTTIQIVLAVAGFISIVAGFLGGAWINQRGLEKQMESFRNEIKAELRAAIDPLRVEVHAVNEKVDRIDQIFRTLYQPIAPPGRGD